MMPLDVVVTIIAASGFNSSFSKIITQDVGGEILPDGPYVMQGTPSRCRSPEIPGVSQVDNSVIDFFFCCFLFGPVCVFRCGGVLFVS